MSSSAQVRVDTSCVLCPSPPPRWWTSLCGGPRFALLFPCQVASRALTRGRAFISIVSTTKLIQVTLPQAPKNNRVTLLENHIKKSANTGLPVNLSEYLNRELSKLKGGGQSKKGGSA